MTGRKIGDRRRAQRIVADKQRISTRALHNATNDPLPDNVLPIETVSNRRNGDQPPRNSVRKTHAKRHGNGKVTSAPVTSAQKPNPSPAPPDPFASFDRNKMIERYQGGKS